MSPRSAPASHMYGEFAHIEQMHAALDVLSKEQQVELETYTAFDYPEADSLIGLGRSRIGWVGLCGGMFGLVASYGIQWWANVHSYPIDVGGRPVHAVPAFLLATFEGTVLCAALAIFFGLLIFLRFPKLWAPEDEIPGFERATIDRFWLAVGTADTEHARAHVTQIMEHAGAIRVVHLEDV